MRLYEIKRKSDKATYHDGVEKLMGTLEKHFSKVEQVQSAIAHVMLFWRLDHENQNDCVRVFDLAEYYIAFMHKYSSSMQWNSNLGVFSDNVIHGQGPFYPLSRRKLLLKIGP